MPPTVCLFRRIRGCYNIYLSVKVSNTVELAYTGTAKDRNFSVAAAFRFMQTLEVWILATVLVYCHRKFSVMAKFGLREAHGSLCDDTSRMYRAVLQHTESLLVLFTKLI